MVNWKKQTYMIQLAGFVDKHKADYVYFLKMSLHGLKQSSRQWNKIFGTFMPSLEFKRSEFDYCGYFKSEPVKEFVFT